MENVKAQKVPSGYVSNLPSCVSDRELHGLKSHDHHVLLQQILPTTLQNVGNPKVVGAVIRVPQLFQGLCGKVIDLTSQSEFMEDVVEIVSILEKEMSPSFFDSMTHLMVHLVQELYILGPVHTRCMHLYKYYYRGMKGFVKNLTKPKGNNGKAYEVKESLGFVTKYMVAYMATTR